MKCFVWIFAAALLFCATSVCERFEKSARKRNDRPRFPGTWTFISLAAESEDGESFRPYGENLYGRLIYTEEGQMSVFLMLPGRPKFEKDDIYGGTPEEIKGAFENFDAYCGTYQVDAEQKTVTHKIEGSRFPNWEGTEQIRHYTFRNDTLILSAALDLMGKPWQLEAALVKK